MIPIAPYQNGHYNPYPLYTIEARDEARAASFWP